MRDYTMIAALLLGIVLAALLVLDLSIQYAGWL